MKKRVFLLVVALTLALSTLCASAEVTLPVVDEPVTFSMVARNWGKGITNRDPMPDAYLRLCEESNINWDITDVTQSDWDEKVNLIFASGNLPDVFLGGMSAAQIYRYNTAGYLIDMKDLIDQYAPNLKKLMEESEEVTSVMTLPNGQIATLPSITFARCTSTQECPDEMLYINKVWLDQLGLAVPTNADELYTALCAFRDNDMNGNGDTTDEIPFTVRLGVDSLRTFSCNFGTLLSSTSSDNLFLDGDTVEYVPVTEEYKTFVKYLNKLYADGLLDPEFFTLSNEQIAAKALNEDLLYGSFYSSGNTLVGEERADQYVPVMPFENDGKYIVHGRALAGVGMLCISSACKDPVSVIKWADLFYDPDYGKIAWMGTEGVSYEYNDDGTWQWIFPEDCATVGDIRGGYTLHSSGWIWVAPQDWFKLNDASEKPINEQRALVAESYPGACRTAMPTLYYDDAALKDIAILSTDLNAYESEKFASFVVGQSDIDAEWDEFCTTLRNTGADELVAIAQKAYDNR